MNALGQNRYTEAWRRVGESLPHPGKFGERYAIPFANNAFVYNTV